MPNNNLKNEHTHQTYVYICYYNDKIPMKKSEYFFTFLSEFTYWNFAKKKELYILKKLISLS